MTPNNRLSLKLSPEAAKVLPFLIAAKKRGNTKEMEWATREYERAEMQARYREESERRAQERRERFEWERRLIEEEQEREYQAWLEEQRIQDKCLEKLSPHWALEDGWEEFQPTQSSQKGWRRMLSECRDLQDSGRDGKWGQNYPRSSGHYSVKHNAGRKPRKPWFK